ncbi:MAG: NUDIX hydrolase [Saccharolobus sp.]
MNRPLVAVGCLIVSKDRSVLLVKRKNPPNEGLWAIPGGKVEYGETIINALKREMKEETNLDVSVSKLVAIVEVIVKGYHYVILDFECKPLNDNLSPSSDALDVSYIPFDKLNEIKTTQTTYEMLERYFKGEELPIFITHIST